MNSFGRKLRLTTFGESHGPAIGGVIDGFPAGFKINFDQLYADISKRSPGSSAFVTQRKETDRPEFLSGINTEGITLGTPIGYIIRNQDNLSKDYSEVEHKYRPNHADFTYDAKYGIRDFRGGGRASARETANWVVAGALAEQWLQLFHKIQIHTELTAVGKVSYTTEIINKLSNSTNSDSLDLSLEEKNRMMNEIKIAKEKGDSIGGVVTSFIHPMPVGIGEPVFDKLHSRLAQAMMSINAAKGFEYGLGNEISSKMGSEVLDVFYNENECIKTRSNFSGGIQGGISNGMPVYFNVYFKPTPTIMKDIPTVTDSGEETVLRMKGRHDPCVAVRGVPIVKAMTALVLADFLI